MRRSTLVGVLLVGKGIDAVSTVFGLRHGPAVREMIPVSRSLVAQFGPVGGMVVLTLLTVAVVAVLAEFGVVVERLLPEVTPRWYAPAFRTAVYLLSACWFATLGVRNLLLVL